MNCLALYRWLVRVWENFLDHFHSCPIEKFTIFARRKSQRFFLRQFTKSILIDSLKLPQTEKVFFLEFCKPKKKENFEDSRTYANILASLSDIQSVFESPWQIESNNQEEDNLILWVSAPETMRCTRLMSFARSIFSRKWQYVNFIIVFFKSSSHPIPPPYFLSLSHKRQQIIQRSHFQVLKINFIDYHSYCCTRKCFSAGKLRSNCKLMPFAPRLFSSAPKLIRGEENSVRECRKK